METKTTTPKVGQIWQRQEDGQRLRVYGVTDETAYVENEECAETRHGIPFDRFPGSGYVLVKDYIVSREEQKLELAREAISQRIQHRKEIIEHAQWIIASNKSPDQNEGLTRKIEKAELQIALWKEIREDLKTLYSETV